MDSIVEKYVSAGQTKIKAQAAQRQAAEMAQTAAEARKYAAYVEAAQAVAMAFVPEDLQAYLTIADEWHAGDFAAFTLALPGCFAIGFNVHLPTNTLHGSFTLGAGKPYLTKDYEADGYPYPSIVKLEAHDRFTSQDLDSVIALAYERKQLYEALEFEAAEENKQRRAKLEAQEAARQAQEAAAPTTEQRLAAAMRDMIAELIADCLPSNQE